MNKSKKLTAAVAATAVASAIVAPVASASVSFSDINGSYAKDAILELANAGIIVGENGKFNPSANIKRQDFAIIMAKALNLDLTKAPANPTFTDVPKSHYSYAAVEAAVAAGLLKGEGNGKFGLGTNLTREAMATVFVNALGVDVSGYGDKLAFADKASIQSWAKDAVAFAVDAKLLGGDDKNNFNPAANAQRQQVAIVASNFLKAQEVYKTAQLKFAEIVNNKSVKLSFTKAVDAVAAADVVVKEKATGKVVAVSNPVLAEDKKSATITVDALAASTTYTVAYKGKTVEATTPELVGAKVTVSAANKIKVEFGSAVDKTEAELAVKFGFVPQDVTAEWAADGKSVVLVSEENFFAGEYTVSLKGLGLTTEEYTVEITDQKLVSFDIKSDRLTAVNGQDLYIAAVDQYGNEFDVAPGDFTVTARNVTTGAVVAIGAGDDSNEFTLSQDLSDAAATVGNKIVVTIAHNTTGLSATKTFTVAAANVVSTVALDAPQPLEDQERIYVGDDNIVLPVTLKDQYGTAIDVADSLFAPNGEITFISSDADIVDTATFTVDVDGNLTFDVGADSGKVTITVFCPASGESDTITFEVFDAAEIDKMTLQQPTGLFVAEEDIEVGYTAVDSFGKAYELDGTEGIVWFSNKPEIIDVDNDITVEDGKLYVTPQAAGSVTLSAFLGGVKQGEITLNVKAVAVATKITKLSDSALTYLSANDGTYTYTIDDLVIVDQYNRVMSEDNLAGAVTVAVKDESTNVVTTAGGTLTAEAEGSKVVTVTYTAGALVLNRDFTATVVAANKVVGYELQEISNKLLHDVAASGAAAADYDKEIVINNGLDADNHKIALSALDLADVYLTTSNENVVAVNGTTIAAAAAASEGDKATVTAWKAGKKISEIEFTVSEKTPTIAEMGWDDDFTAEITGAGTLDLGAELLATDQYGVDITASAIVALDDTDGIWFSSDSGVATVNTDSGVVTGVDAGTVTITFVAKNGKTITQTVTVK